MKRLLLLLLVVVVLGSGCESLPPYAAIVNGEVISSKTMDAEIRAITSNRDYAAAIDQSLSDGSGASGLQPGGANTVNSQYVASLVQNRILVTLIDQEVNRKRLEVTPEQRAQAEQQVIAENDPALWDTLNPEYREYLVSRQAKLSAVRAARSTPEALKSYYDNNTAKYQQYCVSHILVEDVTQADSISGRLASGGDFASIAKAESIDNRGADGGSAAKGGELGCFSRDDLQNFIPEFRDGVFALDQGQTSQPVQSQFGYHIIRLTTKKQLTFEEAQAEIKQQLESPSQFFSEALSKAEIKVNPRYGDYVPGDEATGQPGRVVPHQAPLLPAGASKGESGAGQDVVPQGIPQQ